MMRERGNKISDRKYLPKSMSKKERSSSQHSTQMMRSFS